MPNIFHKRSLTSGSIPTVSSLSVGEIAINVPDGKIYIHKSGSNSNGESIESAITTNSTANIGLLMLSGSLVISGGFTSINSGSIFDISAQNILFDFENLEFTGSFSVTGSSKLSGPVGIGAAPSASTALDIRAQNATDVAFRVRNSANTANPITITNDTVNVGASATGISSTLNVYSTYTGGNYLKLINDTSNFSSYHGLDMIHTGRPGFFALETAGNQGSSITRFRGGGSSSTNAKITAYIDHPSDTDKQGHWHFRTQVHLGDAYRAYSSSLGVHTFIQETGSAPTISKANAFIMYASGSTVGNAKPYFRTENGTTLYLGDQSLLYNVTASAITATGNTTLTSVTASGIILANNYINVDRGLDANTVGINIAAGTAHTSVLQLNTDQPNSKSVIDSRNGYSLSIQTNDVERALLSTSLLSVRVPMVVTGSLVVTGGVTGSLQGSASYATQALSASFAPSTDPFPYTGNAVITGSLKVSGSLIAGNPIPLAGTIKDGVTSVLGNLQDWNANCYQGNVLYNEVADVTLIFGQLCYRTASGTWALADASTASEPSTYMLGICLKDANATETTSILLNGFVQSGYVTYLKTGEPIFMSTTPGSMDYATPSGGGNAVRIVGHTFWDTSTQTNGKYILHFNPENSWIEL